MGPPAVTTTPETTAPVSTAPSRSVPSAQFIACHSILHLDARHVLAQRAVLDPQIMHRTVMSGFYGWVEPGDPDARAQMGILNLWNLDLRSNKLLIVVQSRVQPDWSALPANALVDDVTVLPVDLRVRRGETFGFRTVVNPARHREVWKDTPQGRERARLRLADTTPRHAREWFAERLQPEGAEPVGRAGIRRIGATGDVGGMAVRILPKLTFGDSHRGQKIGRAEIRGALTVTDPDTFVQALTNGIGRGRAYSSGLLLVRPRDEAGDM
ncbi:type I-E CRISPR-associated protein Cas6/Cse3/CasE [Streptomyces cucumeris]|uniref:type I-E CRISPR-associated protein Cas6/Cse3/CasE n=1 Tax=Streptomyces cucumeris TaxID=2962890 RepID=UPI003D76540C